jgi:dTDP-4-dehydrorhamnose reductase
LIPPPDRSLQTDARAKPTRPDSRHRKRRLGQVVITGAGGQLGTALAEAFADVDPIALAREDWDVREPYPRNLPRPDLILHAAAWTNVDGAEEDRAAAFAVNDEGTRNVAALGAPVVYFSTDYVFDGRKGEPYVESDEPAPLSAYGESKLAGERHVRDGWIVRSSWLFGATGHNFVRTMLRLGAERDEVAVVDDQRGSPTYVGHLAEATRALLELPYGIWHVAADGDCTWSDFAEAVFTEAKLTCRIRRISTEDYGAPAPRPLYSVLRSEHPEAPLLPHWREGLTESLRRLTEGTVRTRLRRQTRGGDGPAGHP